MARILVIDDDEQVRSMFRMMLEREGYDVTTAADGKEGLQRYCENPADLVITDLIMPRQEGIETIMQLRREFPDTKIIAISGGGRADPSGNLETAMKLGANRTFVKPVDRKGLLDAVAELLAE